MIDNKEKFLMVRIASTLTELCVVAELHERDAIRAGYAASGREQLRKIRELRKRWTDKGSTLLNMQDVVKTINIFVGNSEKESDLDLCQKEGNKILPVLVKGVVEANLDGCYETILLKLSTYANQLTIKLALYIDAMNATLEASKLKKEFIDDAGLLGQRVVTENVL